MFCENCGSENQDNARFCSNCGKQLKKAKKTVVQEKNMSVALVLSFFLAGLGLVYAGDKKKGIILAIAIVIFTRLRRVGIFYVIAIILWVYALYETYREVKSANGEENPNLVEDIIIFTKSKYFLPVILIALLLVTYYFFIRVFYYPGWEWI